MGSYILTTNRGIRREMRAIILLSLASLVVGAPQGDTGEEAVLDVGSLDTLQEDYVETNNEEDVVDVEVDNVVNGCPETNEYKCVPYYRCNNGIIITDDTSLIIWGDDSGIYEYEYECPGLLDLCCKNPDFIPPPQPKRQAHQEI